MNFKKRGVGDDRSSFGVSTRIPFSEENRFTNRLMQEDDNFEDSQSQAEAKSKKRPSIIPPLDLQEVARRRGLGPGNNKQSTSYTQTFASSYKTNTIMHQSGSQYSNQVINSSKELLVYAARLEKRK
jgi:hypothetical protein